MRTAALMNTGNTDNSWINKGEVLPTSKTDVHQSAEYCLPQLLLYSDQTMCIQAITMLVHYTSPISVNNLIPQADVWHVKECKTCMLHMQPYCL